MQRINGRDKLSISLGLNTAFTVVELIVGITSGSLALIADGMRNLTDSITLSIALIAEKLSQRTSDKSRTFGYGRVKIVASLINTGILSIVALLIGYEAVLRFGQPRSVSGAIIALVAVGGALVNGFAAFMLHRERKDLNIGATYTGLLYGAFGSVGIAVAGVLIIIFKQYWIDDVAGIAVAIMLLVATLSLARDAVHILLEGVPAEVDMNDVEITLLALRGIRSINHMHAWTIGHFDYAFSCQIEIAEERLQDSPALVAGAKEILHTRFGFSRSSLEVKIHSSKT